MTFTYTDPLVRTGPPAWRCAEALDSACVSLLNQQLLDHGTAPYVGLAPSGIGSQSRDGAPVGAETATAVTPHDFCDLQRSQYVWIDPGLSLSSEYDLVCSQRWKVNLLDTLFFVGFMAGNGIFGGVGDRHGRRATLAACAAVTAALVALSMSPLVPPGPGSRPLAASGGTTAAGSGGGGGGYWLHLLLRCASGAFCAGQALGGYVLATELVGPAWRGAAGMLVQSFFIFGEFLLVGLSLAFRPWRALTMAVAVSCCGVLLLVPLVPESPRWLLLHGKADRARSALLWVARVNRVRVLPSLECTPTGEVFLRRLPQPPEPPDRPPSQSPPQPPLGPQADNAIAAGQAVVNGQAVINGQAVADGRNSSAGGGCYDGSDPEAGFRTATAGYDSSHSAEDEHAPLVSQGGGGGDAAVGLCTALAHSVTRRLLLYTCFVLFALSVSYYGVTLALGSLVAGSLHMNFFLTAAAELPGYLVLAATTDHIGRRSAIISGAALSGVACLACAFTTGGYAQVLLAMAGKLGCSGAWAVGLTFAAELFPTCLRSAALSVASQCGDLGGLVTPVLLLLTPPGPWQRLPFAVMGVMALAAVALVAQLPETRGMPQLDTFPELLDWLRRYHRKATAATAAAASAPATNADALCALQEDKVGSVGSASTACAAGGVTPVSSPLAPASPRCSGAAKPSFDFRRRSIGPTRSGSRAGGSSNLPSPRLPYFGRSTFPEVDLLAREAAQDDRRPLLGAGARAGWALSSDLAVPERSGGSDSTRLASAVGPRAQPHGREEGGEAEERELTARAERSAVSGTGPGLESLRTHGSGATPGPGIQAEPEVGLVGNGAVVELVGLLVET